MALDVVLCTVGFVLLYYGAEWLVKGSSNLARSLGVPALVIGLTVVAFGTSAPELVVSLISSVKGKSMIAVGNVFGSNVFNIALVLGLAATLQPIVCDRTVVKRDIPIMLGITLVTLAFCYGGYLGRIEGAILFLGVIAYTFMNYKFAKRGAAETVVIPEQEDAGKRITGVREMALVVACCVLIAGAGLGVASLLGFEHEDRLGGMLAAGLILATLVGWLAQERGGLRAGSRVLLVIFICAGIYGVVLGAQIVVDAAERIMLRLNVDEKFVGLTIVAFGTSLPELATSIVAALRREMDISVGNLVGSNVFNLLSVLGLASLVRPITIPGGFVDSGLLYVGVVFVFGVSFVAWIFMFRNGRAGRLLGFILLLYCAGYIAYLIETANPPVASH